MRCIHPQSAPRGAHRWLDEAFWLSPRYAWHGVAEHAAVSDESTFGSSENAHAQGPGPLRM